MTRTVKELIGCIHFMHNLDNHRKLNLGIYNSIHTLNAVVLEKLIY